MIAARHAHRNGRHFNAAAPRAVIVGCGRSHRCDDQIGLLIADLLSVEPPPNTTVVRSEAPGADLLTEVAGADLVIIVDAAAARETVPPGRWRRIAVPRRDGRRLDVALQSLSGRRTSSSHLLGVGDALVISRDLGLLPSETWIYVVYAGSFGYGDELSGGVWESIREVAGRIQRDVREWMRLRSQRHA